MFVTPGEIRLMTKAAGNYISRYLKAENRHTHNKTRGGFLGDNGLFTFPSLARNLLNKATCQPNKSYGLPKLINISESSSLSLENVFSIKSHLGSVRSALGINPRSINSVIRRAANSLSRQLWSKPHWLHDQFFVHRKTEKWTMWYNNLSNRADAMLTRN